MTGSMIALEVADSPTNDVNSNGVFVVAVRGLRHELRARVQLVSVSGVATTQLRERVLVVALPDDRKSRPASSSVFSGGRLGAGLFEAISKADFDRFRFPKRRFSKPSPRFPAVFREPFAEIPGKPLRRRGFLTVLHRCITQLNWCPEQTASSFERGQAHHPDLDPLGQAARLLHRQC